MDRSIQDVRFVLDALCRLHSAFRCIDVLEAGARLTLELSNKGGNRFQLWLRANRALLRDVIGADRIETRGADERWRSIEFARIKVCWPLTVQQDGRITVEPPLEPSPLDVSQDEIEIVARASGALNSP